MKLKYKKLKQRCEQDYNFITEISMYSLRKYFVI